MKQKSLDAGAVEFESQLASRMKLAFRTRSRKLLAYESYYKILSNPYLKQIDTRYTKEYR
jgi:hypothetical protein